MSHGTTGIIIIIKNSSSIYCITHGQVRTLSRGNKKWKYGKSVESHLLGAASAVWIKKKEKITYL